MRDSAQELSPGAADLALHAPQLSRYFRYYVQSPAEEEKLLAETTLTAWNLWPTYNPTEGPLRVWLFSIAQIVLRRRNVEPAPLRLEADAPQAHAIAAPAGPAAAQAVALSRPEHEVLALRYGGELDDTEIAQVTGLRREHVHVIVQRALRKLGSHIA